MTVLINTSCCGIEEISGLCEEPIDTLYKLSSYTTFMDKGYCMLLFTDAVKFKRGENFKNYIVKNKLGDVIETKRKFNPNSYNMIKAYIWSNIKFDKIAKILDDYCHSE